MPANHGFEIQPGDLELLHDVHRLRAATLPHLTALSGRSEKALRARLLKLVRRRYLATIARMFQKHVYVLGPEATPVLIDAGFAAADVAPKRSRDRELKPLTIHHLMFVSDILTKLLIEERAGRVKIIGCEHDGPALWDYAIERNPEGEESRLPVRPDLRLAIKDTTRPEGRNVADFFLEADRGTMSGDRMEEKIRAYLAYYRGQRYLKKYPTMKMFQVLTVTETASRARYLETHLAPFLPTGPARRAYHFVPFERLALDALFPARPDSV